MIELTWSENVEADASYSYIGEATNDCDCGNGKPCFD